MEIWKQIENTNNYYISSFGNVKAIKPNYIKKERILKPFKTRKGYLMVDIALSDGTRKTLSVHRLVALHFIPLMEGKPQVNHKNEIKTDNHVDNLEWVNNQENMVHSHAKTYHFKSPEGEVVEVVGLNAFCRKTGLEAPNMHKLWVGSIHHNKGWTRA